MLRRVNFYKITIFFATILIFSSCVTPQVYVDYDEEANLDKYTSYNFYAPETVLSVVEEDTVMGFIEKNLQAKGLETQVISKFSIDFYVEFFNVENPIVSESGYAMFNNDFPYMALTINFSDALTSELFWQAVVESKVSRYMTEEEKISKLQEFVNLALEKYPPKPEDAPNSKEEKETSEEAAEKVETPEKGNDTSKK